MQKSEDAAIPMPLNSEQFIVGNADILAAMPELKPLPPFSEEAVSFLNALSALLLKTGKAWSDVATFAFWCRKSALMKEKRKIRRFESQAGQRHYFPFDAFKRSREFCLQLRRGTAGGKRKHRPPARQRL